MASSVLLLIIGLAFANGALYRNYLGYRRYRQVNFCWAPNFHGLVVKPRKAMYTHDETIELSCQEGYRFKNVIANSTCRVIAGFFGGRGVFVPGIYADTCEEIPRCRAPNGEGIIVNGSKALYEEGENVTISCEEGYQIVGSDSYTCEVHTSYYGRTATFGAGAFKACQKHLNCPPPKHAGLVFSPAKEIYEIGENITLSCEEGYELTASETSICLPYGHFQFKRKDQDDEEDDDELLDDFFKFYSPVCSKKPRCRVPKCPGLILSPEKDTYDSGDRINITCEDGYDLHGPETAVCGYDETQDLINYINRMHGLGSFQPKLRRDTCSKRLQCKAISNQVGLIVDNPKDAYDVGETVQLRCEEGYQLVDASTVECIIRSYLVRGPRGLVRRKVLHFSPRETDGYCEEIVPDEQASEDDTADVL